MHFALRGYIHTRFGQSAGVLQGIGAATSNKNNQWYKRWSNIYWVFIS